MTPRGTESTALAGRGVAVTRCEEPGGALERRLTRLGARVLRWSTVEIAPPADPAPLHAAAADAEKYDWLVLPSAHAAAALARALASTGSGGSRLPPGLRVAAVGRPTATAARRLGWRVDRVPAAFGAAGLLASFAAAADVAGARLLLPQSARAAVDLAAGLAALGAVVETCEAYRVLPADLDAAACRAQLAAREVDALTFTSPSAVDGLAQLFGTADFTAALRSNRVVSIGPTTSRRLVECGRAPDGQADPSTLDGLVAALLALFEAPSAGQPAGRV